MSEEKLRLGGMALANGVLVHGPNAWACAVRLPDGTLKQASAVKRFRAARVEQPLLRGPARVLEVFTLLPEVRRSLPEARFEEVQEGVISRPEENAAAIRRILAARRAAA